jgi:HEAT repeat protein
VPPLTEPKKQGAKEEGRPGRQDHRQVAYLVALADDKDVLDSDPLAKPLQRTLQPLAIRAVSDPRPRVRLAAVDAIEPLSRDAASILPYLARTLQDPNNFVRWASARVVGKIGPVNPELTVPLLARLLGDEDLDVELAAATALALYGAAAADAVPALSAAVGAGDVERRVAAIHSLEALGKVSEPAIPMMTEALAHKDPRVRRAAAEALAQYGPAARSATAALERTLTDIDPEVRKLAADALLAVTASK